MAADAVGGVVEGEVEEHPSLLDGMRAQVMAEAAVVSLAEHRPGGITYWQPS